MDVNFKGCHICGSQNSTIHICDNCKYSCCQLCINSHRQDKVCELITDHLVNISDKCMQHGHPYSGLCIQCSVRTCKDCCRENHKNHTVFRDAAAVKQVKALLKRQRDNLGKQEQTVREIVNDAPSKSKELESTEKIIQTHSKRWKDFIEKRNTELLKDITDDMNQLDNECDKLEQYRQYLIKTIAELVSLEKIQNPWTFIPAWVSIARNLSDVQKRKMNKSFPEKKIFITKLEDPTSLFGAFGVIRTAAGNEAEFQLQTTKTLARKELLTPDQGDDKDVISDAVLKTKTANDKEADLRSQDKMLCEQLKKEVLKLKAEVEELAEAKSTNSCLLHEKEKLESEIRAVKSDSGVLLAANTALDFEKSEMDKTIKGLYQSALKMRQSKSVDCFDSEVDEKTVTEVVNFVENEITEFHQDLTSLKEKVMSLEEFIKAQEKSHNEKIVDLQERSHQLQKERDNFEIENKKVCKERDDLKDCRQTVNDKIQSPGQVARDGNETHTDEISKLQHQLTQLKIERDGILKDYQTVCKERDDIIASRNTLQDEICLKEEMVKANSATKYEELKKLQHQTETLKTEKDRNLEEYHKVCKERDELKDGAQSIQKVFDEYDNTMRNMTRSLEEKEREHLSKQHTFSNQLKEKDIKISDLNSLLNHQKRLLSEKEETIRVIKKEKDDLQTWQQTLKQQLKEKENTISELNRMHTHHKGIISDHEGAIRVMKREKDDLQTRLSSVAGEKLTKGNPSITDLGDPNRPMKIGEKYGELYDNEWTDAMENIKLVKKYYPDMKDNEIEKIIIRHLQRLLKCCYGECLRKAEDQIHTLGKALAETMCLTFESKEEIQSLPVCKEASVLRRTKSENFAKFLVQNKVLCNNTTDDWDYINKNGNVMQILMESTFFEKCVYLCWCMVIQDPIMYLDDDPIPCTPIDKNTYKEFVKSGDSVAYVVWPALFLHKDGPLLYKGVVQAYWKKDDHDNVEGTEV